jgi:hypothetical protein
MRAVVALLGVALLAGCRGPRTARGDVNQATHPSPRVSTLVLITVDGAPASRLEVFGGPVKTPALTRLVGLGARALEAWTAVPMTRPAIASMFTGVGADRHGVLDDLGRPLEPSIPVLAESLRAAGYRTAAFPTSPFLASDSGLLRGFEVFEEPEPAPVSPAERVSAAIRPEVTTRNVPGWIETLDPSGPAFLWNHFPAAGGAEPLLREDGPALRDQVLGDIDTALEGVLQALETRGRLDGAEVLIIGTYGEVWSRGAEFLGPGLSPSDGALRVPFLYKPGRGRGVPGRDAALWGPDVGPTLAAAGGVSLAGSEGRDLGSPVGELPVPPRTLFAWSAAPREQMGWESWTAGIEGRLKVVVGFDGQASVVGSTDSPETPDPMALEVLRQAVVSRSVLPAEALAQQQVGPLLERAGVERQQPPAPDRCDRDREACVDAARLVWDARWKRSNSDLRSSAKSYSAALDKDPGNLAALVEWGRTASEKTERGRGLLRKAAALYATDPTALHWLAHALMREDRQPLAKELLERVGERAPWLADPLYDLACLESLDGNVARSAEHLRDAIVAGFRHWEAIHADPDLRNLRADPAFGSLMQEFGH